VKGEIHINEGAKRAITDGSSLLPVGVVRVVGNFSVGDVVSIVDENSITFAKGKPNFSSGELNLIKGFQVTEVHQKLGNDKSKEVIEHRNIHLIED